MTVIGLCPASGSLESVTSATNRHGWLDTGAPFVLCFAQDLLTMIVTQWHVIQQSGGGFRCLPQPCAISLQHVPWVHDVTSLAMQYPDLLS